MCLFSYFKRILRVIAIQEMMHLPAQTGDYLLIRAVLNIKAVGKGMGLLQCNL